LYLSIVDVKSYKSEAEANDMNKQCAVNNDKNQTVANLLVPMYAFQESQEIQKRKKGEPTAIDGLRESMHNNEKRLSFISFHNPPPTIFEFHNVPPPTPPPTPPTVFHLPSLAHLSACSKMALYIVVLNPTHLRPTQDTLSAPAAYS
jgi:hypothetical protein